MLYQGIIGGGSSPVEPVDLSPVLLWTNPSPTNEFAAQTIELDLTDYAGVIIEYYGNITRQSIYSRVYVKKDDTKNGAGYFDSAYNYSRNVTIDNSGVNFTVAKYLQYTDNNSSVIPYKIYGVREYVVESNLSTKIVPSDYVNFNASTGFTAVVGAYYAVVQGSDSNADPTFNGATILKTGYNQRTSSADRAYLSIIQATSTTITSNKNGTYCALNLE